MATQVTQLPQDHPRTLLNNELQSMSKIPRCQWEIRQTGPDNSPTWCASVYLDDMHYGTASAATKGAAQDEAARQAYNKLKRERGMSKHHGSTRS